MHANARNCDAAHRHATATGARMQHLTECVCMQQLVNATHPECIRMYQYCVDQECILGSTWAVSDVQASNASKMYTECTGCKMQAYGNAAACNAVVECSRMQLNQNAHNTT